MNRSCNHIRKLLAAFVDGELSQSEGREIDIHIGRCVGCRAYAESLWRQREFLIAALTPLAPAGSRSNVSGDTQTSKEGSAILIVHRGEALVDHRPVHTNTVVAPGKRMDVPMGAVVHLHLSDGSFLYVESQSRLSVDQPGDVRLINLEEGIVEADILSAPAPFVLKTPAGELTLTSGRFHINVSASGVVQIHIQAGWARFSNQHGECRIYRDGAITVTHREAPPRPAPAIQKGAETRRNLSEGRDRVMGTPRRRPAEPRPFISTPQPRSRSPRRRGSYRSLVIILLIAALAGFLYLGFGRTWTRSWTVTVADYIPAEEQDPEDSLSGAKEIESQLRHLLWGQTNAADAPPDGRDIMILSGGGEIELRETEGNIERAQVFLRSKYHPEQLDLSALRDDLVYTVIITVATGTADLLDHLNREAMKSAVARYLSDDLGLRIEQSLRPFFDPHIASPPDSAGRIAVTARGALLKRIPALLASMPATPLPQSLADAYEPDNAAWYYVQLSRMDAGAIGACTLTVESALDPARVEAASACVRAATGMLALLDQAAEQKRADFGIRPISTDLAEDEQGVAIPVPPLRLVELAAMRALVSARTGAHAEAVDQLSSLYKMARDYRLVPGNVDAFLFSIDLELAAARFWNLFLSLDLPDETRIEAARRIQTHFSLRPRVDVFELAQLDNQGSASRTQDEPASFQELMLMDRHADCANHLLQAGVILDQSRRITGVYPATLADATAIPEGLALPMDAFTGSAFGYITDGTDCRLWSSGPDGIDQGGGLIYDPTNGVLSEGDVVWEE